MAILLTPLVLAVAPVSIDVGASTYNHATQVSESAEVNATSSTMATTTFNGTQTYTANGKPFDSDNDSDTDPY